MKKIFLLFLCAGMLVACHQNKSTYKTQVSDADKVLIKDEKLSLTKQDYFEALLNKYGSTTVLDKALEYITTKEITDQKAIDNKIKQKLKEYESYNNGNLNSFIQNSGYKSKEEFINNVIKLDAQVELLYESYITKNFNKIIEEYEVSSFKMASFEKESDALNAIKKIKSVQDFDKYTKGYNSEDAGVITKESVIDENLKKSLKDLNKVTSDGIYKDAIKLSNNKYAIIYLYDTDHKNKDKIISNLISVQPLVDHITGIYLKKYHFEVHEDTIKDAIKKISSEYIE